MAISDGWYLPGQWLVSNGLSSCLPARVSLAGREQPGFTVFVSAVWGRGTVGAGFKLDRRMIDRHAGNRRDH